MEILLNFHDPRVSNFATYQLFWLPGNGSTSIVACEQSPCGYVYIYGRKITGPVGMAQKFNFHVTHLKYMALTGEIFDELTDLLML